MKVLMGGKSRKWICNNSPTTHPNQSIQQAAQSARAALHDDPTMSQIDEELGEE